MTFVLFLGGILLFYFFVSGRTSLPMDQLATMYKKGAVLVDVRTDGEVQSTPVKGAKHIPLHDLKKRMKELPKDKDVILFCRSGRRSGAATRILKREGWTKVYNGGGYQRWQSIVKQGK